MVIDRSHVREAFRKYTDSYDSSDPKIALKIAHTYRVAAIADEIAQSLKLEGEARDLAWLCGMLHDVGRFEQIRRFGTFNDAQSVDHAGLGADLLFGGELAETGSIGASAHGAGHMIRDYVDDCAEDALIEAAVREHSALKIRDGLDERTMMYCRIIRDADKIDILRVNIDTPLEDIYNTTTAELEEMPLSPGVMDAAAEHRVVPRSVRKNAMDSVAGHVCLVYELVYPKSYEIVNRQGYLSQLIEVGIRSKNPATRRKFLWLALDMEKYLSSKTD